MTLTDLKWMQNDPEDTEWTGVNSGIYSNVIFTISLSMPLKDEYLITANIKHIKDAKCIGLAAAKEMAQALLNSYAISQAIL